MPTYCLREVGNPENRREVFMHVSEFARRCRKGRLSLDGKRWEVDLAAQVGSVKTPSPAGWPLISDAAGVHPRQIPEAKASLAAAGIRCEFTSTGAAIFESRGQRKAVLKHLGLHDKDGGYGD